MIQDFYAVLNNYINHIGEEAMWLPIVASGYLLSEGKYLAQFG